jgi:dienelactone hydrolase
MFKWIVTLARLLRGDRSRSPTPLSVAALLLPIAGAVGSVVLVIRAEYRHDSGMLVALSALWVLSPFAVLVVANRISGRWSVFNRAALHGVTLILTVGSLAIYASVISTPLGSNRAVPFLVVPVGSWLLISIVAAMAAVLSRRLSSIGPVKWLIKGVAAVVMFCFVGVTVLLGLLLLDHNQDTILTTPTGAFAVGRVMYLWSESSGADLVTRRLGTDRELIAWIWYPATPPHASPTVEDYLPVPWRTAIGGGVMRVLFNRDLSRVHVHSIRDAELSSEQPSYPVVLMRSGGAALATDYTSLAEDLASHGYVVVGFDAPYRSSIVVLPDGRVTFRAPENNLDLVGGQQADLLADRLVKAWTADFGFVLDQLERLNASDPSGRFMGRLDIHRVGVCGHSLGGATALSFCHDDSRCKAGIDLDGAPVGRVIAEGVTQPFMFLLSDHRGETADAATPETIRHAEANIRSIYDRLPGDRRLEIVIRGANHYMFSDGAMLRSPLVVAAMRTLGILRLDGRRQVALTADCMSTFFDVYLKGAPASKLESLSEYPELEIVPRGQ